MSDLNLGNTCTERAFFDDDDGTCWQCGGEKWVEDCFEDTCCCTDPPCCWKPCDICNSSSGRAPA